MAVITLGSPDFNPVPLSGTTAPTPGAPVTVVNGGTMTAMIGETDPIFTAWDRTTGIQITSSQIIADAADIVPTELALSSKGLRIAAGGSQSAYIVITWATISSTTFDYYNIRYRKTGDTYYSYVTSKTNTIEIGGLIPNTSYEFSLASVNKQGVSSAFCTALTETMTLDTTLPATVQTVAATAGIRSVKLTWDHNTELDLASYNIYRHTSNASGSSTLIANCNTNYFTDVELTEGVIKWYWVKAVDTSGNISASYSTSVSATPRNVTTNDIVNGAITSLKTDLAAIDPSTGYLGPLVVGTAQINANAVTEGKILNSSITAAKLSINAIDANGDLNQNTVGTVQIAPGGVLAANMANNAIESWAIANNAVLGPAIASDAIIARHVLAGEINADHIATGALTARHIESANFVVIDKTPITEPATFTNNAPADSVSWADCAVMYKGERHEITDGTCDVGDRHIYWELATPTVFLHSVSLPALTNDGFLVMYNDAGNYTLQWNSTIINGNRITTGTIVSSHMTAGTINADRLVSGSITALQIDAQAITAEKIKSYNVVVDGPSTAWTGNSVDTVSWTGIKVYYEGEEYIIADGNTTQYWIYWEKPNLTFSTLANLPALSKDGALVARNVSGVPKLLRGGTEISGNQIVTGSISTGLLAAGCITAEKIGAGEINAVHIVSGSIDASLISVTDLAAISADLGNVTAGSLVVTTGADKIWLNDGDDGVLAVGGSTKATAPFHVDPDGTLTAASGTIGGWNIDDSYIWSGTKHTTDGYTASAGDVTLNAIDGSLHTKNFYIDADGEVSFSATTPVINGVATKSVEIGDWNMDSTPTVTVSHGIADASKIRDVRVTIRSDIGTGYVLTPIEWVDQSTGVTAGGWTLSSILSTISIFRITGGAFDSAAYDATSYNRGWVTIIYEV